MIVKLQARDTVYTVYSWLVCLVYGCYACCPEMYWYVSTSGVLFYCLLVDAIVYFSTLLNVPRRSFPHFNFVVVVLLNLSLQLRKSYPQSREN